MKVKTFRLVAAVSVAAAAFLASTASAATIQDLEAMGFQVGVASTYQDGNGNTCTIYDIVGFGVNTQANACDSDFQSEIDSLADPVAQCNRVWQYDHPDQLAAFQTIAGKGYSISGDQCADSYTVIDPTTGQTVYSGGGSGLVDLAGSLGAPGTGQTETQTPAAPSTPPTVPATCLPLCPTTSTSTSTATPAAPVATVTAAPTTSPGASGTTAAVATSTTTAPTVALQAATPAAFTAKIADTTGADTVTYARDAKFVVDGEATTRVVLLRSMKKTHRKAEVRGTLRNDVYVIHRVTVG